MKRREHWLSDTYSIMHVIPCGSQRKGLYRSKVLFLFNSILTPKKRPYEDSIANKTRYISIDANIAQAVKKCYKWKNRFWRFQKRFFIVFTRFFECSTPPYSPFGASLQCKGTTFGEQMDYSCNANGVQLKDKRSTFLMKRSFFTRQLIAFWKPVRKPFYAHTKSNSPKMPPSTLWGNYVLCIITCWMSVILHGRWRK